MRSPDNQDSDLYRPLKLEGEVGAVVQLVELARLLARQAAQAYLCGEPAADGRDQPQPEPTPSSPPTSNKEFADDPDRTRNPDPSLSNHRRGR